MDTSFILNIPAEEYHKASADGTYLSSHLLGDYRLCPELYHKKITGAITQEESTAYHIGRAAHALILEGKTAFDEQYSVSDGPVNPKTGEPFGKSTKTYADWLSIQVKDIVSTKDYQFIEKLCDAVKRHEEASKLLAVGEAEGTVRAEYCGVSCQIRMDYFSPEHGIIDLKTCEDLTWFERDFKRFGYAFQLAFYRAVLRTQVKEDVPIHIIAVEKREPYRVGVWRLCDSLLNDAERVNVAAIRRLQESKQNNYWPTGYEAVRILNEL